MFRYLKLNLKYIQKMLISLFSNLCFREKFSRQLHIFDYQSGLIFTNFEVYENVNIFHIHCNVQQNTYPIFDLCLPVKWLIVHDIIFYQCYHRIKNSLIHILLILKKSKKYSNFENFKNLEKIKYLNFRKTIKHENLSKVKVYRLDISAS